MADIALAEIQHVDQKEAEFYQKTAKEVEQATGQPTAPDSLRPEARSSLENITKIVSGITNDPVHIVGSEFEKRIHGESSTTEVRTIEGHEGTSIGKGRRLKMDFNRLGFKKAA